MMVTLTMVRADLWRVLYQLRRGQVICAITSLCAVIKALDSVTSSSRSVPMVGP